MKIIITCILLALLTSCSVVNKVFRKQKQHTDSLSVVRQVVDSTSGKDSLSYHKEDGQSTNKADSSKENDLLFITEEITQKEYNDSGKLKKETYTKRTIGNKKVKQSFSTTGLQNHSAVDSNLVKQAASVHRENSDSARVKSSVVNKDSDKHKKELEWWWLLLIIPAGWLIKNRKKVVEVFSTIVHFIK